MLSCGSNNVSLVIYLLHGRKIGRDAEHRIESLVSIDVSPCSLNSTYAKMHSPSAWAPVLAVLVSAAACAFVHVDFAVASAPQVFVSVSHIN